MSIALLDGVEETSEVWALAAEIESKLKTTEKAKNLLDMFLE